MEHDELVRRIHRDDADALGQYLELHRPRLLGLLRVIAGQHLTQVMELDDLFQEVSASAIAALAKVPKDAEFDVDAWLDQLARRRVVDAHRRFFGAQKRAAGKQRNFSQWDSATSGAGQLEQWLIASMTSPSMAVSRNFRLARVHAALAQLPQDQQQMLRLRFVDNLTTREIAARMNKTDVAVRVALSRTLKQLEDQLKDPSDE